MIELLLEKPKNLQKETNRFWEEMSSGAYLFNRKIKEAQFLRSVKLDDIIEFYDHFIAPTSERRVKFTSQFFGAKHPYPEGKSDDVIVITDHTSFKRSMKLLPAFNNSDIIQLA